MARFVKLFESIETWEWYTDQNTKSVFLHCLIKASWNDYRWKGTVIKAGSFPTSYMKLAAELGLTESKVRTSIKKLILTGELTKEVTDEKTVITVMNWANYQSSSSSDDKDDDRQIAGKSQANRRRIATTKKYRSKEVKEVKNKDSKDLKPMVISNDRDGWFEEFWNIYPKKIQKKTSEQKFKLHVKDVLTFNTIMFDLSIRVKSNDWLKEDGQYIPNPTTYLNQRRWEDEAKPIRKTSSFLDMLKEEENEQN